ncbi:MAG: hypothetical protein WC966_00360 [Bradymonadales bacterium]|jgi:hypothetical protein
MDSINQNNNQRSFDADAAYEYLRLHGDLLCNARLSHWRQISDDNTFWKTLSQFQAPSGGFKGGIDPDYQGEVPSVHSTIEAMRIMVMHNQLEDPHVAKTLDFLRSCVLSDGTWQERDEVLADPLSPAWYKPAQFRVYETASIAGYGLELGFSEAWAPAVRYVRQIWTQMPLAETAHPYWATLLLLGRSTADADISITLDALDNLHMFVRKHKIDPYDCSTIVEILDGIEDPNVDEILYRIAQILAQSQDADGGITTQYSEKLRVQGTFNALFAVAIMAQRGVLE